MSVRRYLIFPAAFLSLFLVCSNLSAQQTSNFFLAEDELWDLSVWGGEAFGKTISEAFGQTQITMAGFHAGRVIHEYPGRAGHRPSLEYTIEAQPLFLETREHTVYGGGFSPVGLKYNFAPRRQGRYRPYVEFNGGGMFTQKNVPSGRTDSFNFTLALGPGVTIALSQRQALSVGLRYWHLSNAHLGHSNPAFNTIQFVVGYHWLMGGKSGHQRQARSNQPPAASNGSSPASRQPSVNSQ